jgi:hypothetical protein
MTLLVDCVCQLSSSGGFTNTTLSREDEQSFHQEVLMWIFARNDKVRIRISFLALISPQSLIHQFGVISKQTK